MEQVIFNHITYEMLLAFMLGIISLFVYAWKTSTDNSLGYSVNKYMRLTPSNITFHFIASIMVLLGLHELSEALISNFIPALDASKTYHYALSALTGMFGSRLIAWILEKTRKKLNTSDDNIKHIHGENCEHK